MNRALLTSIFLSFGAVASTAASAHAILSTSSPRVGATISKSPSQIVLTFTEALEPAFSSVEVDGPGGAKIASGAPKLSGKTMIVPVTEPLAPGAYHVKWRVTAVDTHKTQGDFNFVVKP